MTTPPPSTKDDLKVAAALAIRNVASSLKKSSTPLDQAIAIISDPEASHTKSYKKNVVTALRAFKESIKSSCEELSDKVKVLDPIAPLGYAHS